MMRPLFASELLDVWEQGQGRSPAEQALLLLAAADPATAPDELRRLSVGQRDARLLLLRAWTFGPALQGLVGCPVQACGERLEFNVTIDHLLVADDPPREPLTLEMDGYSLIFRLPTALDMVALAEAGRADRRWLIDRCLLEARHAHGPVTVADLPEELVQATDALMAEADPQADLSFTLECPACGKSWTAPLDIAGFFWIEISAWAQRTLYEVHRLAAAYGWREADILALSPGRRQLYLEMIGT